MKEEPAPETVAAASPTSVSSSSPIIIQQALAKPEALLLEPPALEPALASSALSQSAPSSFWHIQADHAYQVSSSHPPAPLAGLGGFKGAQGLLLRLFPKPAELSASAAPLQLPGGGMQHALLPADRARQECGRAGSCTSLLLGEPGDMGWWPRGRSLSRVPCHSGARSCRG